MKVIWTDKAEQDRLEIFDYIAGFDEGAAERMNERFDRAADRLKRLPHSAREDEIAGTRELIPHPSYRLVYEIRGDEIWIATIFHTSRQWPPVAEEDG